MKVLKNGLEKGFFYRTNRLDVPNTLPPFDPFDAVLDFCKKTTFRKHKKHGTEVLIDGKWTFITAAQKEISPTKFSIAWNKLKRAKNFGLRHNLLRLKYRLLYRPHTNACGDFTLLSLADWKALHGYPEIQGYSWHIDSLFIYQALKKGIKQKILSEKEAIYHIEHAAGSGFTPENPHLIFERMKEKKIPYLDDQKLLEIVSTLKKPYTYNDKDWGLNTYHLEELWITSKKKSPI
jgi:hypothetical protein